MALRGDWSGIGVATLCVFAALRRRSRRAPASSGSPAWRLASRQTGSSSQSGRVFAALGSLLTVGSFLLTGHTVAHRERGVLALWFFLHLAIAAFRFGSLRPLRALPWRCSCCRTWPRCAGPPACRY